MTLCVIDSSVALAWVMSDESRAPALALLDRVAVDGAVAPGLWRLEVANALLVAERRKRLTAVQRSAALESLAALPIAIDDETSERAWSETIDLAARYRLTVYDATYLELATRRDLPLATLDRELEGAARKAGVGVAFERR